MSDPRLLPIHQPLPPNTYDENVPVPVQVPLNVWSVLVQAPTGVIGSGGLPIGSGGVAIGSGPSGAGNVPKEQ